MIDRMATQTPTRADIEHEPTKILMSHLLADAKDVAVGHLVRMQGEITDELENLKAYTLSVAVAVGVVTVGAVLAGHTLALGLAALGPPPWVSYAIAAVLLIGAGAVIVKRLPRTMQDADLVPEETFANMKEDLRQLGQAVHH